MAGRPRFFGLAVIDIRDYWFSLKTSRGEAVTSAPALTQAITEPNPMTQADRVHSTPPLNTPDLIFKMIEDHKKVAAEYEAICRDVVPGTCDPDPEKESAL